MRKFILISFLLILKLCLWSQTTTDSYINFSSDYKIRTMDSTYTDTLQLDYNGDALHALSFKIRTYMFNPTAKNVLLLTGVERGDDIPEEMWDFNYEIKSSENNPYIIVLIYGDNAVNLSPGKYNDFVRFHYNVLYDVLLDVGYIDTVKSYIEVYDVESSYSNGESAGVKAGKKQLVNIIDEPTSVEENKLPTDYSLMQNYPNPFNPSTTIEVGLKKSSNVELRIFNMLGEEVKILYSGFLDQGNHKFTWNGKDNFGAEMSSGIYMYKMEAGRFIDSKKMILLK